jgi:hypothetical protein
MNQSPTGNAIGNDTIGLADDGTVLSPGQVKFGRDYLAAHLSSTKPFLTDAENLELALGMAKLAGNAVITHVPGWERITFDPTTEDHTVTPARIGFDRPVPAMVSQEDGDGVLVAVWWKFGAGAKDWVLFALGAGLELTNELPLPDGIADPGDVASGQATAKRHVHPLADTAGGDRYLIGDYPAVAVSLYATPVIGLGLNPELQTDPPAAWEWSGVCYPQGGYLGPV